MTKRIAVFLLACLILLSLSACIGIDHGLPQQKGTLQINGVILPGDTYVCVLPEDRMAILPVLTILEHLGAEIIRVPNGEYEWIHVTYDHYTFTFDTSRADLGLEIPDWMESPEWRDRCIRVKEENELYIDSRSVAPLFYYGWGVHIVVDYHSNSVTVDNADPEKLTYTPEALSTVNCRLIVNGKDITDGNYVYINHKVKNAEIPVTSVVKALGGSVQWLPCELYPFELRSIVQIQVNGITMQYDTSSSSFGIGFLTGVDGLTRKIMGREIIIDTESLNSFFYHVFQTNITVDYTESVIYVDSLSQ